MQHTRPFDSLYAHGFLRLAAATPRVALANPAANLHATLELARAAEERDAALVLLPELGLTGYSLDDLALQDALLDAVDSAIATLLEASRALRLVILCGAPLRIERKLFNCALIVHRGALRGVVPKSYLPDYREFYEPRQYTSGLAAGAPEVRIAGQRAAFGTDLLFEADEQFVLHVEICEDLWVPLPPSTRAALAGATVLTNLSASNATIGKADYRRLLCQSQSAKCIAAYAYSGAGYGESTTDLAWDGHALICENGEILAESPRFRDQPGLISADVDLERLRQERMRMTSFNDCARQHRCEGAPLRRIALDFEPPRTLVSLAREIPRFPFVPGEPATLDERCRGVYQIQVQGLARRLEATGLERLVIGISGGLDSTHALLVCAAVMDALSLPRTHVLGFTLPGFATGEHTRANALGLMQALGVSTREIDIRPSAMQMLRDLDHPYARGEPQFDVTFENVQAGERTSHLFRLANFLGGLVVGTSDLSELALGYTTYGVGDHMAHYAVNASVPKTLIQHLIRWVAHSGGVKPAVTALLEDILRTRITPELVPARSGEAAFAETVVGPYALQDFFLYYISRFGYRPSKVAFLAHEAWARPERGTWPASLPEAERCAYDLATIKKWLAVFLLRFFQTSQFKRSALPNGPKVGSGGSLSPRADWRAPSDARADAWLEELRANVPD